MEDALSLDWTKRYPNFLRILRNLKRTKEKISEIELVSLGRFFQLELLYQISLVKRSAAYRLGHLLTSKLRKAFHWARNRPMLARLFSSR